MTSLGTKSTNQIHSSEPGAPLVIRIPREHTPFKIPDSAGVRGGGDHQLGDNGRVAVGPPTVPIQQQFSDSRSKVLQNLAKKISQKSKRLSNSINSFNTKLLPPSSPKATTKPCPSCGHSNPQHKKRCGYCSEFVVGWPCPSCSTLNYHRAKTCIKCGTATPPLGSSSAAALDSKQSHDPSSHDTSRDQQPSSGEVPGSGGEVPGSGGSESSSHPTSPLSPKFSAPPIRSAVLKSLFPQQVCTIE